MQGSTDSFGAFVCAPRAVPAFRGVGAGAGGPGGAVGLGIQSNDGFSGGAYYCPSETGESLTTTVADLEEELAASRQSFEIGQATLARTNAQLILQVRKCEHLHTTWMRPINGENSL